MVQVRLAQLDKEAAELRDENAALHRRCILQAEAFSPEAISQVRGPDWSTDCRVSSFVTTWIVTAYGCMMLSLFEGVRFTLEAFRRLSAIRMCAASKFSEQTNRCSCQAVWFANYQKAIM